MAPMALLMGLAILPSIANAGSENSRAVEPPGTVRRCDAAGVEFSVAPAAPFIEPMDGRSKLNFDVLMNNVGGAALALREIDLVVRDRQGTAVMIKELDHNGSKPAVELALPGSLRPGARATVFNPFFDFPSSLPLDRLDLDFVFRSPDGRDLSCPLTVRPRRPPAATAQLPLAGRLLAWDTHDFFSHHRRRELNDNDALTTGRRMNSSRYAYDFSKVDEAGLMFRSDGKKNEDWFSWDQPVFATAAGTVVRVKNDQPDQQISNPSYPAAAIKLDPWNEFGNSVLIDQGNGVFALLAHMRHGSVKVRVGDAVKAGEEVGKVGFSGAVLTIHTHFELRDSSNFVAEGVPVQFRDFNRVRGRVHLPVERDAIDTGEIVQSQPTSATPTTMR